MELTNLKSELFDWFARSETPLILTATVLVVYVLLNMLLARLVKGTERRKARKDAVLKVTRTLRLVTGFFSLLIIMVVWGIEFSSVTIFASTTVTLLGVALFASWSLLSNITAYFVLLFHPSFTRGTFVRIIEADNYVEGYVADLALFSLELITENKATIVYPNNMLLSRVVLVDPPDRLNGVGKVVNPQAQSPADSAEAV